MLWYQNLHFFIGFFDYSTLKVPLMLESGEFSHSESGKNDRFWFKENSHT